VANEDSTKWAVKIVAMFSIGSTLPCWPTNWPSSKQVVWPTPQGQQHTTTCWSEHLTRKMGTHTGETTAHLNYALLVTAK